MSKFSAELKTYWAQWESLIIIDSITYRKWENNGAVCDSEHQIILPTNLRKRAFSVLHESITSGYLGQQKTLHKVRQIFWLVGYFGLSGPLRQYFSLYQVVSQREGAIGEKG